MTCEPSSVSITSSSPDTRRLDMEDVVASSRSSISASPLESEIRNVGEVGRL